MNPSLRKWSCVDLVSMNVLHCLEIFCNVNVQIIEAFILLLHLYNSRSVSLLNQAFFFFFFFSMLMFVDYKVSKYLLS